MCICTREYYSTYFDILVHNVYIYKTIFKYNILYLLDDILVYDVYITRGYSNTWFVKTHNIARECQIYSLWRELACLLNNLCLIFARFLHQSHRSQKDPKKHVQKLILWSQIYQNSRAFYASKNTVLAKYTDPATGMIFPPCKMSQRECVILD